MTSRKAKATNLYVPVHLRAKVAEEEKKKPMDITNRVQFPTLGNAPVPAIRGVWGGKTSFKTTVEQMIVNEQKTKEEHEAEAERQRAMEGWEVLDCPKLTAEWGISFNTYIGACDREADRIQHLIDIGCYVEPIIVKPRPATKVKVDVVAIREWNEQMDDLLSIGTEEDPELDTFDE